VDSSIPSPGPTINTSYFPDTKQNYVYWSSTTLAGGTHSAWYVYFYDGRVRCADNTSAYHVRAVRGGQFDNSFIDNFDGTITDTSTGLMWQQDTAPGRYNWEQALTYCENLSLAGKNDWRLPNRNELQSIVDYSRYNPAIDTAFFPDTGADYYWSSTTGANYPNEAWAAYFFYGYMDGNHIKDNNGNGVRAVCGGQCGSSGTSTILPTTTTTSLPETSTTTIPISATTTFLIETTSIPGTTTTTVPAHQCAAEAIYGSDSEETELLREYRDKVLSKSASGRQMIKAYYELSPAVSEVLQKNDTARANARKVLDSLMPAIREKVKQ